MSVAAVSFAAVVAVPRIADACSPPAQCEAILPAIGGTMPASAPAIPVVSSSNFGATTATPSPGLSLRTADGTLVAGALTKDNAYHRFFLPASPLVPGSYTMTLADGCTGADGTTFTVTPSVALPAQVGQLRVARAARQNGNASTSSGSCSEKIDAGVVDLAIDLDAKTVPYASVLAWAMRVDTHAWYETTGPLSTLDASDGSMHGALRLFTACDVAGRPGRHDGLPPGTHDIELRATLVGSTALIVPAKLRVKVTCGADNGDVLAAAPASTPPATGGTPDGGRLPVAPPATTSEPVGDVGPSNASSGSGGCSAARRSLGSEGAAIAGACLALAIAARRA